MTRSGSKSAAIASAPAAVPVTNGSKPARRSASAKGSEIDSSSSTTRIRAPVACRAAMRQL